MNPTTLYNPATNQTATPISGVTPIQQQGAYDMGFRPNPSSVNTPIPSGNLGTVQPLMIPPTPTQGTGAAGLIGVGEASVESYQQVLDQKQAQKQQEADQSKSDLKGIMGQYLGVQASRPQVEADLHVDELGKMANESFTALQASQRALQVELKALDSANLTDSGRAAAQRDIQRAYAFEQADLSISLDVANRNYTSAQNTADKKIAMQLEPLKTLIDFQKMFYDENREDLSKAEERQFQNLLTTSDRKYQTEENNLKTVSAIQLAAASNGAPSQIVQAIGKARDQTEAIAAAGTYLLPKASAKAPEVKSINGVDMQWNSSTGKWESIAGDNAPGALDIKQKSIDQLTFLRDTATKATELSEGSGPSNITKFLGDTFVGDSQFRQLEALTNTLKTNVLALMTDPGIKKFFGPQMSNADVLLMTSTGTTLNPEKNSPEQLRGEIKRLDDLFNRMQTAVTTGSTQSQNIITAPTGELIKITD